MDAPLGRFLWAPFETSPEITIEIFKGFVKKFVKIFGNSFFNYWRVSTETILEISQKFLLGIFTDTYLLMCISRYSHRFFFFRNTTTDFPRRTFGKTSKFLKMVFFFWNYLIYFLLFLEFHQVFQKRFSKYFF